MFGRLGVLGLGSLGVGGTGASPVDDEAVTIDARASVAINVQSVNIAVSASSIAAVSIEEQPASVNAVIGVSSIASVDAAVQSVGVQVGVSSVASFDASIVPTFTPASLFASSEEGAWYDPSDLSTLYQDSAGTTPVTADGDPVGLVLDKRLGLVPGAEQVTNGTFDTDTAGWTPSAATLSVVGGQISIVPDDNLTRIAYQSFATTAGRTYELNFDYDQSTSTTPRYFAGTSLGGGDTVGLTNLSGAGEVSRFFVAQGATTFIHFGAANSAGQQVLFDNISVREIPGNHATQATAAARPLYKTSPSRLVDDGVDDALNWTAPADDYTIARVNSAGTVTILTAQALSGATDILLEANIAGYVAIDRALTSAETTSLTTYLEGLV